MKLQTEGQFGAASFGATNDMVIESGGKGQIRKHLEHLCSRDCVQFDTDS
jgi:hypothetical protein